MGKNTIGTETTQSLASAVPKILERAKHSFFALPNPLSCSVMNKICLNQRLTSGTIYL